MKELEDATGVGRETIRFYIREGLLPEPERKARNVAAYSEAHVTTLKTIKRLQEERFLPLEVIKRVLKGDPNVPTSAVPFPRLPQLMAERFGFGDTEPLVPLAGIAKTPQDEADIADFIRLGIIRVLKRDDVDKIPKLDARIIHLWQEIRRAGYMPPAFPADHLSAHLDAANRIAVMEVERFYDGLDGRIDETKAAMMAQVAVDTLNSIFSVFHIRAIIDEVAKKIALWTRPDGNPADPAASG